jgi:hypothetical protein
MFILVSSSLNSYEIIHCPHFGIGKDGHLSQQGHYYLFNSIVLQFLTTQLHRTRNCSITSLPLPPLKFPLEAYANLTTSLRSWNQWGACRLLNLHEIIVPTTGWNITHLQGHETAHDCYGSVAKESRMVLSFQGIVIHTVCSFILYHMVTN